MKTIALSQIVPGGLNPRKTQDKAAMEQLTASIKEKGVLQPIIVRNKELQAVKKNGETVGNDIYEIVCGARRCAAAKALGLKEIPAVVMELTDAQAAEVAITENLQREDMNPIEEARAYDALIRATKGSPEALAVKLGKGAAYIAGRLKLLTLCPAALKAVEEGEISVGHGAVLARIGDPKEQAEFFKAMSREKMSVRQAENALERAGRMLNRAPFDTKDCKRCPSNGAQQKELFDGDTDLNGRCLNTACFAKKADEHLKARLAELKAKGEKVATKAEVEKQIKNFSMSNTIDFADGHYGDKIKKEIYAQRCKACPQRLHIAAPMYSYDDDSQVVITERCLKSACYRALARGEKAKAGDEGQDRAKEKAESQKKNRVAEARMVFWLEALLKDKNPKVVMAIVADRMLNEIDQVEANKIAQQHGVKADKDGWRKFDPSTLFPLDTKKMHGVLEAAAMHFVVQQLRHIHSADVISGLATLTGHSIAKEWVMTETYLQACSKDELLALGRELGLKDLPESKADRVAYILKHAPKGKVPKELLA